MTRFLANPKKVLLSMLDSRMVQLPHNIQAVYLQNCLKILAHLLPSQRKSSAAAEPAAAVVMSNGTEEAGGEPKEESPESNSHEAGVEVEDKKAPDPEVINLAEIQEYLKPFISSEELEVQERAGCLNNFIKCYLKLESKGQLDDIDELSLELASAFSSELNPVAVKAQKKVPVPENLDLDAWINDPPSESEDETTETTDVFVKSQSVTDFGQSTTEKKKVYEPTAEELTRVIYLVKTFACLQYLALREKFVLLHLVAFGCGR